MARYIGNRHLVAGQDNDESATRDRFLITIIVNIRQSEAGRQEGRQANRALKRQASLISQRVWSLMLIPLQSEGEMLQVGRS